MPNKISNFWKELKRRKVIKVLFMYAGAAIVLIGLASDITGLLNLPESAPQLIIILVIIGFPLAMIFSWIFDITPEGIKRTIALENSNKNDVLYSNIKSNFEESIAILPFEDLSPKKDQEYFCDGISEEIISALTHVESLKVIARTSAFAFKEVRIDIREIGRKLNVEHLLEGSVRKDKKHVRITAQLIKIEDGSHLWSEVFNRDMKDIFEIQEEIALAIVKKLKVNLLGDEIAAIARRYTEDVEAFNIYLKGLYYWQKMTPDGNKKAVEHYEKSVRKDPQFALGWSVLGANKIFGAYAGFSPPRYAFPLAKEIILKALELDNTVTVAHATLAIITMYYDWNWEAGEQIMLKGLRLNPNSGWDHWYYSVILQTTHQFEKAIAEGKRALELDPFNIFINTKFGETLFLAGKFDKAFEKLLWTIELHSTNFLAHFQLGEVYRAKEMFPESIEAYEKAVLFSGGIPLTLARLACVYYETGRIEEAEEKIQNLLERREKEYVPCTCLVPYYILKEDYDQAFEWLEKAIDERDIYLAIFFSFPVEEYRMPDEPRFNELIRKTGLDKYQH